jgi:hypothetical protein
MRRSLRHVGTQLQHPRQGLPAETHVHHPAGAIEVHRQQHVAARRLRIFGLGPQHARRQIGDLEADLAQRVPQQQVLLEAIAAAPPEHQLALDVGQVQADRQAQERVQVFERDRLRMMQHDRAQHRHYRRDIAAVADAGKIGGKV